MPGQSQHKENWTWRYFWNLLTRIDLKNDKSFHNFIEFPRLYIQANIYSAQSMENAFTVCDTPPPPNFHHFDMIWSLALPLRITST